MPLCLPFPLQDNTLKSLAGTAAAFQICIDVSLMGQVCWLRQGWEVEQVEVMRRGVAWQLELWMFALAPLSWARCVDRKRVGESRKWKQGQGEGGQQSHWVPGMFAPRSWDRCVGRERAHKRKEGS